MADVNFAQLAEDFFMESEFDAQPSMQTDHAAPTEETTDTAPTHAMARMPSADDVSIHDSAPTFGLSFDQYAGGADQLARSPPDEGDTLFVPNPHPPIDRADVSAATAAFVLPDDPPMLAVAARQPALVVGAGNSALPGQPIVMQEDSSSSEADPPPAAGRANATPAPQVGRVDASKMPEVTNPLDKAGRHTVIVGHLPASHPYSVAATQLGVKMVSRSMRAAGPDALAALTRPEAFTRDLQEFLSEISAPAYKAPVIGGGLLDLFQLVLEVLRLGGVENVVASRAFRIVGQQLELPMTCTSAAYVLKNAYNRLLYYYERMLVLDEYPVDGAKNVDIKSIVQQKKQGAKAAKRAGTKRRAGEPGTGTGDPAAAGAATMSALAREMTPAKDAGHKRMRMGTEGGESSGGDGGEDYVQQYMDIMATSALPEYRLPEWATVVLDDRHYQAFIDACHLLDDQRAAQAPIDVVLIAFAHCFERSSASLSRVDPTAPDRSRHALARHILAGPTGPRFPAATALLTLLTKLHDLPAARRPALSAGPAGNGLLRGLVSVLDTYHDTVLAPLQAAAHVRLLRLDKAPEAPEESFRLVSAAYCAANALDVLAETPDTLSRLAADGVLARALVGILSAGAAHEAVEREAWQLLSRLAHADATCAYRGRVLAEWLAKEALLRLELTGHEADKERIERERRFVSNAVTGIGGFARRFRPEASVGPVLDLAARILRLDPASHGGALADATLVGQVAPTALLLAYSLAAGCPEASRGHQGFVRALIGRMVGGEPASFGDAALVVLHRTRPLVEYAPEIVEACSALQPRSPVLEVVQEIVADLFVGQCEMEEPEVDEEVLDGGNADVREVPHEPEEALEADQGIAQRMEEGMEREIEQNAEQDAPGEVEQEVDQGAEQEFFVGGDDLIAEEQQES